jgi:hypothetical protein
MIEKRFMSSGTATVHPTRRDPYANDLKDMFDFESFAVAEYSRGGGSFCGD